MVSSSKAFTFIGNKSVKVVVEPSYQIQSLDLQQLELVVCFLDKLLALATMPSNQVFVFLHPKNSHSCNHSLNDPFVGAQPNLPLYFGSVKSSIDVGK